MSLRNLTESDILARNARVHSRAVRGAEDAAQVKQAQKKAVRRGVENGSAELRIAVQIPPSINECYTNMAGKGGKRRVLTKEAKHYKYQVTLLTVLEALQQKFRYAPKARLSLTLNFYFADRRKDASNHIKLIEDSLASALGFNDRFVDVLHVERKGIDAEKPRCEVVLRML